MSAVFHVTNDYCRLIVRYFVVTWYWEQHLILCVRCEKMIIAHLDYN